MEAPEGDELDAWPVYADWLQNQPDPHERALGEAIISDTSSWPEDHREAWLGPLANLPVYAFGDWLGGFPRTAKITVDGPTPAAIVAQILGHRAARRVTRLELETSYEDDATIEAVVALLVATRRPRCVTHLEIRNAPSFGGPYRTDPVTIGDVSGLWHTFALETFVLEGNGLRLGAIHAPALRHLRVDLAGREPLERIAAADLRALDALDLRLGPEAYPVREGWREVVGLLGPVLDPDRLVGLRALTLRTNHDIAGEMLAMLPHAARLPRLATIDLFMRTVTPDRVAPYRGSFGKVAVRLNSRPVT